MRIRSYTCALLTTLLAASGTALATPSTVFWAPSTPALQPFGVLHLTYDTYFGDGAYPIDLGLTVGLLPWKELQLEVGFDLFYPTLADGEAMSFPIQLNAKIGTPEDTFFTGQPGWSVGIYGLGFKKDVTDYDILYAVIGKTLGKAGTFAVGGYYGLNGDLFHDPDGDEARVGLLASWTSIAIDVPVIDKLVFCADVQTGKSAFGGAGGGVAIYFTPAIALLTGPVFFFSEELQPGGSSWLWSAQLDVDVDFTHH